LILVMGRILRAEVRTRRSGRLPRQKPNQQAHRRIDLMQAAVRIFGRGGDACHAVTMTRRNEACTMVLRDLFWID
jgi:hypothetical protein